MNPTFQKTYLGDGAYVHFDEHGCVVLTAENGYRTTNTVVLEPEVFAALVAWLRAHGRLP